MLADFAIISQSQNDLSSGLTLNHLPIVVLRRNVKAILFSRSFVPAKFTNGGITGFVLWHTVAVWENAMNRRFLPLLAAIVLVSLDFRSGAAGEETCVNPFRVYVRSRNC